MKTRGAILLALFAMSASLAWPQSSSEPKPAPAVAACAPNRADLEDELQELNTYTSRMQSRIVMIRNSAGVVENPQLRNALQVDADMWQDELDHLKKRAARLQAEVDKCEKK